MTKCLNHTPKGLLEKSPHLETRAKDKAAKQDQLCIIFCKNVKSAIRGTWLAQLVEQATLELRAVSSSPSLGIEFLFFFLKKFENHSFFYLN